VFALVVLGLTAPAFGQPEGPPDMPPPDMPPPDMPTEPPVGAEPLPLPDGDASALVAHQDDPDMLFCEGGWRHPLIETRQEIGPARFARQLDLQKDISLTAAAFGYCETAARNGFGGNDADSAGPCYGLLRLAGNVDLIASNLFRLGDQTTCECLTSAAEANSDCEGLREQMPTLRRYDQMIVDRAELVLSYEVCTSPERSTNRGLRNACATLEQAVADEHGGGEVPLGMFTLSAPLPPAVAQGVVSVKELTDGRFLSVVPENFIGVRDDICHIQVDAGTQNQCEIRVLDAPAEAAEPDPNAAPAEIWGQKRNEVMWGMCNELAISDVNANTCRAADVYIDERGQIHMSDRLVSESGRKDATLCIDVSDFDQDHPLMVTLGLDPTGSVPERIWPGETMRIGELIDRPVSPEDVLHINVYGKPRGISLSEVLRINGIKGYGHEVQDARTEDSRKEACRIAREWVPVVDHEVPVGDPSKQAVIPIKFGRGRDGETRRMRGGDYVVLWVRDIEPAGSVMVEYSDGQTVGHQPPPLLGGTVSGDTQRSATNLGSDDLLAPSFGPGLASGAAGVELPSAPRRARYPGSRVLRMGSPDGNTQYDLKVCTKIGAKTNLPTTPEGNPNEFFGQDDERSCSGKDMIVDEKLLVHGDYHMGLRIHFGYTLFPISDYTARRTEAAVQAGTDVYEVVETGTTKADTDVAVLLAVYPFGRDPKAFSYNPLSKDYWKHTALLAGFTVTNLTSPWDDFYLGGSLPIANGVSFTALAHFSKRDVLTDVDAGDLFTDPTPSTGPDLEEVFDTKDAIAVGVSFGVSFDYDLFERAFINVWNRLAGNKQFTMRGSDSDTYNPYGG
jgi:hypothetical protein